MKRYIYFCLLIITGCKWAVEEPDTRRVKLEMTSTDPSFTVAYYKFTGMSANAAYKFTDSIWTKDTIVNVGTLIEFSGYPDDELNNTIETRIYVNDILKVSKSCTGIISGSNNAYINFAVK